MLYDAATKTMNVRYSQEVSVTTIAAIFGPKKNSNPLFVKKILFKKIQVKYFQSSDLRYKTFYNCK
jgi:hypothetical protein